VAGGEPGASLIPAALLVLLAFAVIAIGRTVRPDVLE